MVKIPRLQEAASDAGKTFARVGIARCQRVEALCAEGVAFCGGDYGDLGLVGLGRGGVRVYTPSCV